MEGRQGGWKDVSLLRQAWRKEVIIKTGQRMRRREREEEGGSRAERKLGDGGLV